MQENNSLAQNTQINDKNYFYSIGIMNRGRTYANLFTSIESEEERSKFEQLYFQYRGLMYHVAMRILNNPHSAEDVVHQAFLFIKKI